MVRAVFENGVFKPTHEVVLPEHCEVEFEPRIVNGSQPPGGNARIYEILSRRYDSGHSDTAERHNEHQP